MYLGGFSEPVSICSKWAHFIEGNNNKDNNDNNDNNDNDKMFYFERNWVLATNSNFLLTISSKPNCPDLKYLKLWFLLYQMVKSVHNQVAKI